MASLSVAAIVVSHGKAELLAKALDSIAKQNHPLQQVAVVETSNDEASIHLAKSFGFAVVTPGDVRFGAAIQAGINSLAENPGWIWVMHDDLVADANALSHMARAAEISPSVAIIGPKLLESDNSIQIQQMGLTATRTGRPFLLVQNEYDQGQHDRAGDTLSVSTAGMLFSLGVWQQFGGLDDSTPPLAQDLEFGAKARVAGYRVIVEASAKMHHQALAMRGARSRKWLGGSVKSALSKAHIHMATLMLPLPAVIMLYLAMPLIVLASSPFFLVAKQPTRIFGQLSAWLWSWIHIRQRFAARARFRSLGAVKVLRPLLATPKQLRARRKARFEPEPELSLDERPPGVFRSNSAWFALLPLVASVGLWPQGAITANGFIPLGENFKSVFSATAADLQTYLSGVTGPSDPFTWFAALMALLSPGNPSMGLAVSAFLAPTLGFFGAWFLTKQLLGKPWVITLLSLSYVFLPWFLTFGSSIELVELFAAAFAPWAVGFLLRAFDAYNSARAWRWVGVSGLALALIASISPMIFGFLALLTLVLGLIRPKRLLILIWSIGPAIAILYPWLVYAVSSKNLDLITTSSSFASSPASLLLIDVLILSGLAVTASGSWFVNRTAITSVLWGFSLVAIAGSWYQPIASSRPLVAIGALGLLILTGLWVEKLKARSLQLVFSALTAGLLAGSVFFFGPLQQSNPDWSENRVMPALVVAASQIDPGVRTLEINIGESISADYIWNSGKTLERNSLLVDYQEQDPQITQLIATATANLIAGNSEGFAEVAKDLRVDFVLVSGEVSKVVTSVASVDGLQAAGESQFGSLFRVETTIASDVEITHQLRNYQLGALAAFMLLAIPTRASIRGYRRVKSGAKR